MTRCFVATRSLHVSCFHRSARAFCSPCLLKDPSKHDRHIRSVIEQSAGTSPPPQWQQKRASSCERPIIARWTVEAWRIAVQSVRCPPPPRARSSTRMLFPLFMCTIPSTSVLMMRAAVQGAGDLCTNGRGLWSGGMASPGT